MCLLLEDVSCAGVHSLQELRSAVNEAPRGKTKQPTQQLVGFPRRTQQHQLWDGIHGCHNNRVVVRLETRRVGGQKSLDRTEEDEKK